MTRWGRRVIGLAAAAGLVLAAASCLGDGEPATTTTGPATTATTAPTATTTVPMPTGQQAVDLQARAIARARPGPRLCMAEEGTPAELRVALAPFYDEILYVEIDDQFAPSVGWDHCTLVSATPVRRLGPGVIGVDVWVLRGFLNGIGETYLFRWDGTAWADTTPEETGVTVTTAVS